MTDIGKSRILYYKKPVIGSVHTGNEDNQPIEVVNSNGFISLGVPIVSRNEEIIDTRFDIGGIASAPEKRKSDRMYRLGIKIIFILLFIINITVTSLLYHYSNVVDLSKVEKDYGISYIFSEVSSKRSLSENFAFICTIAILIIGLVSAIFESASGLSVFVYSILLNFILGTQAIPYYAYSYRYLLDFFMVYIALVYRSKLMVAFFLVNFHLNTI